MLRPGAAAPKIPESGKCRSSRESSAIPRVGKVSRESGKFRRPESGKLAASRESQKVRVRKVARESGKLPGGRRESPAHFIAQEPHSFMGGPSCPLCVYGDKIVLSGLMGPM